MTPPTTPPSRLHLAPDLGVPTRVWLVSLLTVLTVELTRAAGPLLDRAFAVGAAPAAALALVAFGGAGLVAALVPLLAGHREGTPTARTVLAGVIALGALRLVDQAVVGVPRLVVGLLAVCVAVAVLTLAAAFVGARVGGGREAATGLVLGTGLSVGLQATLGTWDALWRGVAVGADGSVSGFGSGWWVGWVVAVPLVVLTVLAARSATRSGPDDEPAPAPLDEGRARLLGTPTLAAEPAAARTRPRRLWALGPFLALAVQVLANPAFVAAQSGVALGYTAVALVLGSAAGVWLLLMPVRWPGAVRVTASVLVVLAVAAAVVVTGPAALLATVVALVLSGMVLASILATHRPAPAGLLRTALAVAAVGLGAILPVLLFTLDYDVPLPVDNAWVPVLAATVLAGAGLRRRAPEVVPAAVASSGSGTAASSTTGAAAPTRERIPLRVNVVRLLVLPALGLALLGLAVTLTSSGGAAVPDRAAGDDLVLVSWNLHYGVAPATAVDLEGIARTIEEQDPDVVALQEVSRGWVLGGGADEAAWLARRLGMHLEFAPAADAQFGNALLSRSMLTDAQRHALPYGDGPQQRSALTATLTAASGTAVRITSIHLQHRESNTPTRLAQLAAFAAAEPVAGPSLLAGDLNASPGSAEVASLLDAGWTSAVDEAGDPAAFTSPADEPAYRIDWVLGQQVGFASAQVLDARQSDHRPLVVHWSPAG